MIQNSKNQPLHVVLGASGGAGLAILNELVSQGKNAIGVNSSGKIPSGIKAKFIKADVANLSELQQACEGADYIYNAVNVPYQKWNDSLPVFTKNVIQVAHETKAKLIYVDNLYAYGPVEKPMTEQTAQNATDTKGKLRAQITDQYLSAHNNGQIEVAIVRGSDFYGPNVNSHIGDLVFKNILKDKHAQIIGDINKLHTYTYIKDFARAIVFLAQKPEAYGQIWHTPNSETVTTKALIDEIYKQVGKTPKIQPLTGLIFNVLSLFLPILGELRPLYYQRDRDYIVDSSKFEKTFGKFQTTPHTTAIAETWEWYKAQS